MGISVQYSESKLNPISQALLALLQSISGAAYSEQMQEPTAGKQKHPENTPEKVMLCEKQAPTSFVVHAGRHFGENNFGKNIL